MSPTWRIERDVDDTRALDVLGRDRVWNGYPLADLDPPSRAHATYAIAIDSTAPIGSRREAANLLLFRTPAFTALWSGGPAAGVAAILASFAGTGDLPATCSVHCRLAHRGAFALHYELRLDLLHRMVVTPRALRPPESAIPARQLGEPDFPAIDRLYAAWPGSWWSREAARLGYLWGVDGAGEIVAVAGAHAVGQTARIAAIGGVFTHPEARGRGYAAETTAAATRAAFARGCDTAILNVRADNPSARRVYERLGYRIACDYLEGPATLRPTATPA